MFVIVNGAHADSEPLVSISAIALGNTRIESMMLESHPY